MNHQALQLTDTELRTRREAIQRELRRAQFAGRGVLLFTFGLAVMAVLLALDSFRNSQTVAESSERLAAEQVNTEEALWQSRIAQARAVLESEKPGARKEALGAIAQAAQWRAAPELRDVAIAALSRTDIGEEISFQPFVVKSPGRAQLDPFRISVDPAMELITRSTDDGSLQCARLSDGQQVWEIPGVGEPLQGPVVWSPASQYVAFQAGGKLRVYAVPEGRLVLEKPAGNKLGAHLPMAFSADGRLFFAWVEGIGALLDIASGLEVKRLSKFDKLYHVAFHPTRPWLALATGTEIEVWDYESLRRVQKLVPERARSFFPHLAWSGDGFTLAGANEDGAIYVWDATTFNDPVIRWHVLLGHTLPASHVTFDASGDYLASCAWGTETRLWNPYRWRGEFLAGLSHGYGVRFNPDGSLLAMIRPNQGVGIRPVSVSRVMRRLAGPIGTAAMVRGLAFSADERWIAGVSHDGLFIWDAASNRIVARRPVTGAFAVFFRSRGGEMLVGSESGVMRQPWSVGAGAGGKEEFRLGTPTHIPLPNSNNKVFKMALSRDESLLAAGDRLGQGFIFDLEGSKPAVALRGQASLDTLAFSPDGKLLASGTWQGAGTWIWDTATGRPVHKIDQEDADVTFTADGEWLIISRVAEHAFWNTRSNAVLKTLPRESGEQTIGRSALLPDGRTAVLNESFKRVQLVDIASQRVLASIVPPGDSKIEGMRASPGGRWLAVMASQIYLYDLPQLRGELAQLGLDWATGEGSQGAAGSPRPAEPVRRNEAPRTDVPGYRVALVLAGLVAALVLGTVAQRYQRQLLVSYFELEAVSSRRQQALLHAQAELQHSQKMKALGTLAAGIAHDFNNLLSVIRMANQLTAERTPADLDLQENTRLVEQSVAQGKAVVGSMLGYSRAPAERTAFVVNDAVRETALLLNQQFLRGVHLKLELDEPVPPVTGVRSRLEQVLLNLIVNSAEAMSGTGELRLAVRPAKVLPSGLVLAPRPSEIWVEISVADTGPGIAMEACQRIFEPFFTTKNTGTVHGTGLGLSMVHAIAEGEGFGLLLLSEPGKGTTFVIFVPQN